MTAHECEEYIEEPPQRKRYALRKPERQRDFLRLKLTLPSERRTGKPPPDPLLVLCRLQIHRGSRCSTVTKIPDTTVSIPCIFPREMMAFIYILLGDLRSSQSQKLAHEMRLSLTLINSSSTTSTTDVG